MEHQKIIKELLSLYGFDELNPVQKEALKKGVLQNKSLVISAPTASGKTLCAELAMLKTMLEKRGKVVYIVPLVSLAYEKYQAFKKKYKKFKVAISVGDLDSADPRLADYDLIIASNEKLDSLIRHGVRWVGDVGLIIADEIHLLNDVSRGPTLEILLTRLREIVPKAQIIALSATIRNAKELSKWLNTNLVVSDFRPVKLYEGINYNSKIQFYDKTGYELSNLEQEAAISQNTLGLRKQALFFVATRRSAESLAQKLTKTVKFYLSKNEQRALNKLSAEILNVLEIPTKQCKKLARCIKYGTAFHHAGLLSKQKRLIENNFRSGLIKIVAATPTLALGVNLPAFRVVVRDVKRYYRGIGAIYIPVLEYKQFIGRAGRPQYDEFGESILVAKSEEEAQSLTDRFIMGEPEKISSKLAVEPVLRMHTLALVASEFVKSERALLDFFSKTFYAHQYGDIFAIENKIFEILDNLTKWKFILNKKGKLVATRLGKRVSELYIDPLTAHYFIKCLQRAVRKTVKKHTQAFSFLQAISNTIEMRPLLSIRTGDFSELNELIAEREAAFLQKVPEQWDLEFDDFLRSVKTALFFEAWIEEATEDQILTKFRVAPGELRGRLHIADWLTYALQELALLMGCKEILKGIRKVRVRLKYGVRKELIPLARLRHIGRIRARKLYNANLKSLKDLRKIPLGSLSEIIGPKIAYAIKEQLGQVSAKKKEEKQITLKM